MELQRTAQQIAAEEMFSRNRKIKRDELFIQQIGNTLLVNQSMELEVIHGNNIMILEDKFKSSYDCKTCKGSGEITQSCLKCNGQGNIKDAGGHVSQCGKCDGLGSSIKECKDCNGKGALLEIPDQAKGRPTSGVIVSRGPACSIYNLGDRVAYSGYTGHLLPFKQNDRIRVMKETEPFCIIREKESDGIMDRVEFIDKDTAYDLS